jgi:hypothetical protein
MSGAASAGGAGAIVDRTEHPDAAVIAVCNEYIVNLTAFATSWSGLENEDDPLWHAWNRTRDAVTAARPQTLAGLCAKVRAAMADALPPLADGSADGECPKEFSYGWEEWAWQIMQDLLRIVGEAAP